MKNIEDTILDTKDKLPNVTPVPPGFHNQATAHELKSRLNWGEPGLTILDVRDHTSFGECHIMGAMNMPNEELSTLAESGLEFNRDLYVYGASDQESASAVDTLRSAGFERVAELKGGLSAWREIAGSVEGTATNQSPGADAYNVSSRLQAFKEEKAREKRMS
ncbi:MAG: rhodanese-like domain-containing protein [Leptolyngbyaceae cyanobacterium CRU_2_3]|nr:rhodanese-like domain-containing protein [Leptolyngbyaceae cyanobacterium CRU_2_3]